MTRGRRGQSLDVRVLPSAGTIDHFTLRIGCWRQADYSVINDRHARRTGRLDSNARAVIGETFRAASRAFLHANDHGHASW